MKHGTKFHWVNEFDLYVRWLDSTCLFCNVENIKHDTKFFIRYQDIGRQVEFKTRLCVVFDVASNWTIILKK